MQGWDFENYFAKGGKGKGYEGKSQSSVNF